MKTSDVKKLLSDVWNREISADEAYVELDFEFQYGTDDCGIKDD